MKLGKNVVGIDVGSRMVKAVQLRKSGKTIELEKFGVADIFPEGEIADITEDEYNERRVTAIRRALEDGRISAKQSISGVRGESIIVRYIQLPEMPEEELKNALKWEAEEYIPFDITDVVIDSMVLGKAESGKVDVLLVAAKQDIINRHISTLKEAGLSPAVIDVDSFAFMNCFETNYAPSRDDVVALCNIGANISNINIYMSGTSRFSRDITIAGNTVTSAIQSKLGISSLEAEQLKIEEGAPQVSVESGEDSALTSGLMDTIRGTVEKITGEELGESSNEAIAAKVIKNTLNNLISEIQRSIQFFENQQNGRPVKKLIIGGGSSNLKNLTAYMSSQLNIPVEIIDPLRVVSLEGRDLNTGYLEQMKPTLAVGIGLALRKVVD